MGLGRRRTRRERLCRKYNDEFNSVRLRVFNGSHLTLPSRAASRSYFETPPKECRFGGSCRATTRFLRTRSGPGKTYTMVAAGIELKRLRFGDANRCSCRAESHARAVFLRTAHPLSDSQYSRRRKGRFRGVQTRPTFQPDRDGKLGRGDCHPFELRENSGFD